MAHRWYYQMLLEEFGPVTAEQIRQLRSEGTLADDDLVRREDQESWQPLSTMSVTGSGNSENGESTSEPGPAEIDDLSELSFTFEENRPAPQKPLAREPAAVREAPPAWTASAAVSTPSAGPLYYYQSLGQTLGPMSLPELIKLAESGSLDGTDQVRKGETGAWRSATDYPELAAAIFSAERAEDTGPSLTAATQKRLGAAAFANLQTEQTEPEEMFLEDVPAAPPSRPAAVKPAPAAEVPREDRAASKPSRNSDPGSGKKRRKRTDDAVLEEIFDEVFTEEESTPSRGAAVAASAAAAAATPPVMAAPTPPFPSAPAAPPSMAMPPSMSPGFGAAARPSSPSPALRSTKSSSSGELDGKTIGIAGGALVVVGLIAAYFMGWVELPVSIVSVSQGEVDSALSEVKSNFEKIDIKSVSDADWAAFQTATRTRLAGLVTQLDKSSDPSPEMMKAHRNARKFMTMSYLKVTDKERIKKLKEEIEGK